MTKNQKNKKKANFIGLMVDYMAPLLFSIFVITTVVCLSLLLIIQNDVIANKVFTLLIISVIGIGAFVVRDNIK